MGKRFTDTEKWNKEWFSNLPAKEKLLWLYCCDTCNAAGIADFNPRLYSFILGFKVTKELINRAFGTKVMWIEENKFFIVPFIEFQYEKLSRECRPHLPIIKTLEKYGIDYEALDPDNLNQKQMRKRISQNTRQAIFARDKFECQYCGSHDELTLDHIIPLTQGGTNEDDNLITACVSCNSAKGTLTLEELAKKLETTSLGNMSLNRVSNILNRVSKKLNRVSKISDTLKEKEKEYINNNNNINNTTTPEQADLFPVPTLFDQFWAAFPKKRAGSKDKARIAFQKAVQRGSITAEQLVAKAKEYAASEEATKNDGMYAKGAAPWLNDDRFLQDYAPAKHPKTSLEEARARGNEYIKQLFGGQ